LLKNRIIWLKKPVFSIVKNHLFDKNPDIIRTKTSSYEKRCRVEITREQPDRMREFFYKKFKGKEK